MAKGKAGTEKLLPVNFWAVICTIKQEPMYQFVREEHRLAERMVKKGLLERKADKRYAPTEYGLKCYAAEKLLAAN